MGRRVSGAHETGRVANSLELSDERPIPAIPAIEVSSVSQVSSSSQIDSITQAGSSNKSKQPHLKYAQVQGAILRGIDVQPIVVEVSADQGMPGMRLIGMGDAAIQEATFRVKSAIKSSGFEVTRHSTVVNLAPASIKKNGSSLDLAILVAFLIATGQIDSVWAFDKIFVGELSLTGEIQEVPGMLAYAEHAMAAGKKLVAPIEELATYLTADEAQNLIHINDVRLFKQDPTQVFQDQATFRSLVSRSNKERVSILTQKSHDPSVEALDYCQIVGQELAKRALVIAAAGDHGVLLKGSPGCGKTALAQRFHTIQEPLTHEEMRQVALIYSICGVEPEKLAQGVRPFRSPHHSASIAGLIGGGRPLKPGEISLAHHGVLFLDELSEFAHNALQALRQVAEEGVVHIARSDGTYHFPAKFQLICATNPCACGYLGDPAKPCRCSQAQLDAYQTKLGGPLQDRISLHLTIERPQYDDVVTQRPGLSSCEMQQMVARGRAFAAWRKKHFAPNADGLRARSSSLVSTHSRVSDVGLRTQNASNLADNAWLQRLAEVRCSSQAQALLAQGAKQLHLSMRGLFHVVAVARSIADLEESENIKELHIHEALSFRSDW